MEEQLTAGGEPQREYWRKAWKKAADREMASLREVNKLTEEIAKLKADLNASRSETARWKAEAKKLNMKLAALESSGEGSRE